MLKVRVAISGALLDAEKRTQEALNEAKMIATQEALKRFDTDAGQMDVQVAGREDLSVAVQRGRSGAPVYLRGWFCTRWRHLWSDGGRE